MRGSGRFMGFRVVANSALGEILAAKLNQAKGPVTVVLPLRGVSAIDVEGQPSYDPTADEHLFDAVRRNLSPKVKLVKLDLMINDSRFAERVAYEFLTLANQLQPNIMQGEREK
jgi:uncharacterized protein (UPF0261 family)